MEPTIAATLRTCLDPDFVTFSATRPAPGEEPAPAEVYIGVGTREPSLGPHPRMLSWKLPQWRTFNLRSCAEVTSHAADALDGLTLPISIRLPEPTLDCTVAAVLVVHRVLHHRWPEGLGPLVEYVSQWEQGRTESAGSYERALASVFYGSMQLFRTGLPGPAKETVELICGVLDLKLDAPGLSALPAVLVPTRIARRLRADSDLYRAELNRAWQVQLDLPLEGGGHRRIDALFLSSPQDVTVLKLLARPDTEASSYRRGFELLAMHAPRAKEPWATHTISIGPESPGTLGDLALALDGVEGPTRPDGTPRPTGAPRFSSQPEALKGLSDPWYSDGYAWAKGRSTIVAPPFAGTTLSREQVWEAVWSHFHVGKNVHVTSARTVYCRPATLRGRVREGELLARGFRRSRWPSAIRGFLPSVQSSFLADGVAGDVVHLERPLEEGTVHVTLYPASLALVWVEQARGPSTLLELARAQASAVNDEGLLALAPLRALADVLDLGRARWFVYGAYKINRARSTMLDRSRSVLGLLHAVASGTAPTLAQLPSEAATGERTVRAERDVEHWFTSTGGARFELELEDDTQPPPLDQDFALFLLTTGQRYVAFEISRRMGEIEHRSRTSRWQSLTPTTDLRGDVMFFTNSLWYSRVSDDPDLERRYDDWRELHGMQETVESLRSQTAELDAYRKEQFENTVGLPWTTGGWKIFLLYTLFFSVVVFGAVLAARLVSWRKR